MSDPSILLVSSYAYDCSNLTCKFFFQAATYEHAGIILWDTKKWRQVTTLHSHSLTVTDMTFSHSGDLLLSVSRDRTWSLFRHRSAEQPESGIYLYGQLYAM